MSAPATTSALSAASIRVIARPIPVARSQGGVAERREGAVAGTGPQGIRINSVSPGQVETDLWLGDDGVAATVGRATGVDPATVREQAVAGIPSGRFSTPDEVATLVVLLASPRTANVTGADYVIDGGLVKTT